MLLKCHIMPNVFIVKFDISKKKKIHYTWKELYARLSYFVEFLSLHDHYELVIMIFKWKKVFETKIVLNAKW